MANQIERDVYVLQNAYQQPIPYVRFTNAIPIVFNFRDYDIPEGSTVKAFCAKPSGAAVYSDDVSLSGNTVTITVSDQMFIELGITSLQVQVLNSGKNLVTFGWPVIVQPNYTEGDIPPSQNESGFWNELQQQVYDAVNNCNEAAASVNTAISNAEQATQTANNAAANANEAAQQVFDQQYILTTDYTFPESGTVQPTSYGNAIVQEIDGAIYQGADPSPDNPQFIHGVGDTGFFDGELTSGLVSSSTGEISTDNTAVTTNKILCNPSDVVKVKYDGESAYIHFSYYKEDGTFIRKEATSSNPSERTTPSECKYFRISIQGKSSFPVSSAKHITVTINGNYAVILDTENESLNQSSRTYIPISSPLYSGDKIYQKEMQYRVSRQWGVAVFDGSDDEAWHLYTTGAQGGFTFYIEIEDSKIGYQTSLCNKFKNINNSWNTSQYGVYSDHSATHNKNFRQPNEDVETVEQWKTWLQSNPITVVYQLATPTDEPLSQDGIIAAYSLMACDELTNVSLTGADSNLTLNNIVKFPRNSDGALLTTTRANGVMIELKDQNEDLTTITQQIATLNQFMASFDGKTLYTT